MTVDDMIGRGWRVGQENVALLEDRLIGGD